MVAKFHTLWGDVLFHALQETRELVEQRIGTAEDNHPLGHVVWISGRQSAFQPNSEMDQNGEQRYVQDLLFLDLADTGKHFPQTT
jgi:hypothetical protein